MISSLLAAAARTTLDLVLPIYCVGCGRQGGIICPACVSFLAPLEQPFCEFCADPGVAGLCRNCRNRRQGSAAQLSGIRSPFLLEGLLREAIHCFKYRNYRVAAPLLGRLMASYLLDNPLPGEVLVPVPLHDKRVRERGYNQAELLAAEIGSITGLPVAKGLLARTRNTAPQVRTVDRSLRQANMAGALVHRANLPGTACILVDDVCTTGSTLIACGEALVAAGASEVWALTLARETLASARPLP